jgi:hypothetical protein
MTEAEKQQEHELRGRADQLNVQMVKEGRAERGRREEALRCLKQQLAQAESELQKLHRHALRPSPRPGPQSVPPNTATRR